MSSENRFRDLIFGTLAVEPGLTAREIGARLRLRHGLDVYRSDVNSELYQQMRHGWFHRRGDSPPLWFTGPEPPPSLAKVPWSDGLHAWQREALDAWREADYCGIVEAATGTGKSRIGIEAIRTAIDDGLQALVIVPSIALQRQWARIIEEELGIEVTSLLGGGIESELDLEAPVTIGIVNSVSKQASEFEDWFELVVADECHNYASDKFQNALLGGAERRLGLTATLERSDNGVEEVLHPYFGDIVFRYGIGCALEDDVISPYRVLAIGVRLNPGAQAEYDEAGRTMAKVRVKLMQCLDYPDDESYGEFMKWLAKVAKNRAHEGFWSANTYLKNQRMRREILSNAEEKIEALCRLTGAIASADGALVFTEAISSAERVARTLESERVATGLFHSKIDQSSRIDVLDRFRLGALSCVVAVEALDEGVDVPDANLGIVVAGTRQKRQMIQRIGRVIRKKRDGGSAAFVVLYAKLTSEDPDLMDDAADNLQMLYDHADEWERIDLKDWPGEKLSKRVRKWLDA